jgi:cysteine-S-conjugate beta-lyase
MMALGHNGDRVMTPQSKALHLKQHKIDEKTKIETLVTQAGKDAKAQGGFVNPPIQRGSTIIFDDAIDLYNDKIKSYGLEGTSTHDNLSAALCDIMGGAGCVLAPSGLSAITLVLMALLKSGDNVLVSDSVYGPTRRFCDNVLKNFGIETTYYEPRIGANIKDLIKPNTKLIFLESPGSLSLELQDVPAIVEIAKAHNILTAIDDTWSAGVFFKPLKIGVNISIQALTKYQSGHSDVLMGSVVCDTIETYKIMENMHRNLGLGVSPEDAWLCLRGLRTMMVRLNHQDKAARKIAQFLENREEVASVLHPALESSRDNTIFKRDFSGAGGLFSIYLKPQYSGRVNDMLNAYKVFSMGFSWGGFESLVIDCTPQLRRNFPNKEQNGALVRYSIGLENIDDLIEDLKIGFEAIKA